MNQPQQSSYTHITVLLDRTGSMESIRDDIIGGFNAFLGKQKEQPGDATITLVQFDSQDPYEVLHRFSGLALIPELTRDTYVPRASTPLLDAIGRSINDLESSLAQIDEGRGPGQVMMVIVTDGQENASCEFSREQIKKMIDEKMEKHHWQFVFLSADMSAIRDAESVGIRHASTMHFSKSSQGTRDAWETLGERTADYRNKLADTVEFTAEERAVKGLPKRKKDVH